MRSPARRPFTLLATPLAVVLLALGTAACSGSDGDDEPVPTGGINGPARVDPDSEADNTGG